jgi:thioredoxin reductase (NADPH)
MAEQVIIIGSGPAGYTAALYASRANLEPIVFTGFSQEHLQGGQLMTTTDVENYPGFPDGVEGPELMELFEKQCVRFGTKVIQKEVTKVDFSSRPFKVWAGKDEFEALSVIVATGATAKYLEAPGVEEFKNRGITACATCDGAMPKFRDQVLAVMGGGDTAMEEALFLTKFGSEVHLMNRSERFRASKVMLGRARAHKKIIVHENTVLESCYGEEGFQGGLKGIKIKNVKTEEVSDFALEGLFMAIGHRPNTELFAGVLDMDENGYLITQDKTTNTNIEGVFACGDVQDHVYRQAVTSAGTGCMAAIDAERYLAAQE